MIQEGIRSTALLSPICILLATITNALILMNVSTLWEKLIYGMILIIALYVDKYRRKVLSGE